MIIAIINQNGGAEKSIVACNLAVLHTLSGHRTLLVDADPIRTTLNWSTKRGDARTAPHVPACGIEGECLHTMLENLAPLYDDVIIDAGRRDALSSRTALITAHLAVVPIQPTQFTEADQKTLVQRLERVRLFNPRLRIHLVESSMSAAKLSFEDAARLRRLAAEISMATLSSASIRDAYTLRQAFQAGLSVAEVQQRDIQAVEEMTRLYTEVFPATKPNFMTRLKAAITGVTATGIPQPSR